MHRDKKVGFAMGILLVGIVAAFFFRREPDPLEQLPALADPAALDRQIAAKSVGPYITGLETDAASDGPAGAPQGRQWDLPAIYADSPADLKAGELPPTPAAPDPIDLTARPAGPATKVGRKPAANASTSDPAPIHVGSPFGSPSGIPFDLPESRPTFPANTGWVGVGEASRRLVDPREPTEPQPTGPLPTEPQTIEPQTVAAAVQSDASAASPAFTADAGALYRVRPGDTLSDLALRFLGSSRRYMEIYRANQDTLRSPDDLRADLLIRIPPRNAAPTPIPTPAMPAPTAPPFSGVPARPPFETDRAEAAPAFGVRFTPARHAPLVGPRRP